MAKCNDCELPYEEHGTDITLPNDQWEMIYPEKYGMLCGKCIAVRASNLSGSIAIRAYIDFGLELSNRSEIEKEIVGALKNAIDSHGPITLSNRHSAAKRVYYALKGLVK